MGDKPQPPQLPKDVPADIRDFFECKSATVTLKDGALGWITLPDELKSAMKEGAKPKLTIAPGATPGSATVTVSLPTKLMDVSFSLPATIKDGQLNVDTSESYLPGSFKEGISQSVKELNDWFKANGKGFGPPAFGKNQVALSKVDLVPAPATTTPIPTPVPGPDIQKPTTPQEPPGPPEPQAAGTDWSHLAPTQEQWDKALEEAKSDVPPPKPPEVQPPGPKPVLGAGGPGGAKAPAGLGALAWRYVALIVIAAVLGGGALFFLGPALGLFGAANPSSTPPVAGGTPSPSPAPTPTATPAPRTVVSDDGLVILTIPYGAAPAHAPITVTALGQADAPPELEGVTFRSAFYRIEPRDLNLTGQVGLERTVDLTAQGIDPDEAGYSVTSLAMRTAEARWFWATRQKSLIGGPAGTAPETQVRQQATLERFGDVFGFGGTVWAHRDPYPEQVEFAIGTSVRFGVKLTGPDGGAFAAGLAPTITRASKYVSITGTIEGGEPQISVGSDGSPRVDVTATCRAEGEGVVGVDLTVMQTDTSALLDLLELGPAPDQDLSFRTTMRCVTGITGFQPVLDMGCVSVIHQRLSGIYPSYLHWLLGFRSDPGFPQNATLDLSYREGASGPVMTFGDIPIVGGKATADTGITSFGEKLFVESHVKWSDGSTTKSTLITESDWQEVFGLSFNVTSAEEILAGNACP